MIDLNTQEIMALVQLCSKACLLDAHKITDGHIEQIQFHVAQNAVVPILGRLDKEYPGLMPVPHDGVSWKDRSDV